MITEPTVTTQILVVRTHNSFVRNGLTTERRGGATVTAELYLSERCELKDNTQTESHIWGTALSLFKVAIVRSIDMISPFIEPQKGCTWKSNPKENGWEE